MLRFCVLDDRKRNNQKTDVRSKKGPWFVPTNRRETGRENNGVRKRGGAKPQTAARAIVARGLVAGPLLARPCSFLLACLSERNGKISEWMVVCPSTAKTSVRLPPVTEDFDRNGPQTPLTICRTINIS